MGVTYRVDAAVDWMKAPGLEPVLDSPRAQPRLAELLPGDDTPLPRSDPPGRIDGHNVDAVSHLATASTFPTTIGHNADAAKVRRARSTFCP